MRRHKDAAVFLCGGQTEAVVVLIDGAAHSAQAVVAVGEHIRDGELFQPGCTRRLDNADKSDVMAGHGVKLDLQVICIAAGVMRLQDAIGHGAGLGICNGCRVKAFCCQRGISIAVCRNPLAPGVICTAGAALDHIQHSIRLSF